MLGAAIAALALSELTVGPRAAAAHEGSGAVCPLVIDDLAFRGDSALALPQQAPGSPIHTLRCNYGDVLLEFRWLEVAAVADVGCGRAFDTPGGALRFGTPELHAEGHAFSSRPDLDGVVREHARVIFGLIEIASAPCAAASGGSGTRTGAAAAVPWVLTAAGAGVLGVTLWRRRARDSSPDRSLSGRENG